MPSRALQHKHGAGFLTVQKLPPLWGVRGFCPVGVG